MRFNKMTLLEKIQTGTILVLALIILVISANYVDKVYKNTSEREYRSINYLEGNSSGHTIEELYSLLENMEARVDGLSTSSLETAISNLTNKNNSNNVFLKTYPVGSIYISNTNTNPGTVFGGTWVAFGSGRTLVGVDTSQTEFDTVEETGGAKTHTLTTSELPSHSHSGIHWSTPTGKEWSDVNTSSSKDGYGLTVSSSKISTTSWVTGNTGGGSAHNNLQPYITVYMWKRTA